MVVLMKEDVDDTVVEETVEDVVIEKAADTALLVVSLVAVGVMLV
jgi:hypothetical protein